MSKRHHRYKIKTEYPCIPREEMLDQVDIIETFDKVAAAMWDATHAAHGSDECKALNRMVALAEKLYNKHFAMMESKYSFSIFIACLLEIQMENFNAPKNPTVRIH